MQRYSKEVAEAIVKCRQHTKYRQGLDREHQSDDFVIKDDGVFPVKGVASASQEFLAAVWRPVCDMDVQVKDVWLQPSLPIPFNEKQLAAFFLHGWGWYVRDYFGSWYDGPDDAVFDDMIDPDDDISSLVVPEVKQAVSGAYVAYRVAECDVGKFDNTLACKAQELENAYWDSDASQRTDEKRNALCVAKKMADNAESVWRKKMVNQLLEVSQVSQVTLVDSDSAGRVPPAPAQTAAAPAPVLASDDHAPKQKNKLETTLIFEAKVIELMGKFWKERKPGTEPSKGDLCKLVFQEILRTNVRGARQTTEGMVRDAAKPWKRPLVLPTFVPDSKFNDKRHPFKGDK